MVYGILSENILIIDRRNALNSFASGSVFETGGSIDYRPVHSKDKFDRVRIVVLSEYFLAGCIYTLF
jgi:hypothetical protein